MSDKQTFSSLTRRQFIYRGIGSVAAVTLLPPLLVRSVANTESEVAVLQAIFPELPYPYEALEPYIDARTMQIHHDMHHAGYVRKLNAALENWTDCPFDSLESIFSGILATPKEHVVSIRNNGGGAWNHSFFWETLSPDTQQTPSTELLTGINAGFGSFGAMTEQFSNAAATRFGSGWAWLSVDDKGDLFVSSTPNQDNPLMNALVERSGIPIFGLDVWEHAYYLHYQTRRKDYIQAFWNIINWDVVNKRYKKALVGLSSPVC